MPTIARVPSVLVEGSLGELPGAAVAVGDENEDGEGLGDVLA